MNDDRYAQYGAVTGIVFVVLTVIGFQIVTPTPPALNAASDEWPRYFSEEQGAIRAGLVW